MDRDNVLLVTGRGLGRGSRNERALRTREPFNNRCVTADITFRAPGIVRKVEPGDRSVARLTFKPNERER